MTHLLFRIPCVSPASALPHPLHPRFPTSLPLVPVGRAVVPSLGRATVFLSASLVVSEYSVLRCSAMLYSVFLSASLVISEYSVLRCSAMLYSVFLSASLVVFAFRFASYKLLSMPDFQATSCSPAALPHTQRRASLPLGSGTLYAAPCEPS